MKPKVYIDGQAGTTGLQIYQRLGARTDIDLLTISTELHRDVAERKRLMNQADLVFLCLPDAAAVEVVALVENPATRIIDASTAHRTNPAWVYGYPELRPGQREAIRQAKRVANPGCHATGFISAVAPLVQAGVLSPSDFVACYSLTGYSGGGKGMIGDYEAADRPEALSAPALYGLNLNHKHVPEMQTICGLETAPCFTPVVDDYYKGMATTVLLPKPAKVVHKALTQHYAGQAMVSVAPLGNPGKLYANALAGLDTLTLWVCGTEERCTVTALFDNLGKGASGAAVQNMNLMLGFRETESLHLPESTFTDNI
ncbi:MAG: N-acetyl-gamma-glutamyl-phosphate reductase [Clostridiales bacterium]|nr:N-acetyl-gamma-glutamyl-phosphate reductase [Clostridiales bacterium]